MTYGQLERRNGEQHVGREPRVDLAGQHITQAVSELETHTTHHNRGWLTCRRRPRTRRSPTRSCPAPCSGSTAPGCAPAAAATRLRIRGGPGQFIDRSVGRRWAESSGRGGGPGAAEDRSRRPRYDSRAATSEETNAAELPNPVFLGSASVEVSRGELVQTGKRAHTTHTTHSQMPT